MPIIKIERILSCSSEDPNHPVANLINADKKTWKCKNVGEKHASVILQLEKETIINSIDIGNGNSAFIEVLVGRSSTPDEDFEVLLVASSFMSPLEARSGSNPSRVRMFAVDALSKSVADQKWDRVKVICTQPFNKHVQYGLAFITFHSVITDDKPAALGSRLGRFVVKDDAEEPNSISAGSLFARRKDIESQPLKGAAAIREASSPTAVQKRRLANVGEVSVSKASSPVAVARPRLVQKAERLPLKEQVSCSNGSQKATEQHKKKARKKEEPLTKKPRLLGKPFRQLLEGVVLVISGYQNPYRANLRTMALEMGACYKSDWDSSCTHLVCAFPNTPKFQQVWGKGHIVQKEWIENCHSKRKRLPWRRFALSKEDHKKPESEDEVPELLPSADVPDSPLQHDSGGGSDVDEQPWSGSDTEDEIERVRAANPYDAETDVDSDEGQPSTANMPLPKLPDFFRGKCFYLHKELSADVRSRLKRYIIAFKGLLVDELDDVRVTLIISNKKVQSKQPVVKPDWVWECNDTGMVLPTKPYEFVSVPN
ncbi:DNA repair protein XRCC1-like isoform X2 [Zootermopsis nevadensis]|uniref:DNA repair protein XRCC1-like isoform X2 n=1 Tax=Zootermopsis nevadensis TaxID=136037 RepID=UPI000B8EB99C|nr:DNA repair protein XRCC1-like isoform X2 [Zootermopsis nevadensis]